MGLMVESERASYPYLLGPHLRRFADYERAWARLEAARQEGSAVADRESAV